MCGCAAYQDTAPKTEIAENAAPQTPMAEYMKCMGYSNKTLVHTKENPGRYIVLASEKSADQPWVNKKEQGDVFYTSLLECKTGTSLEQCSDQQTLVIRNIGTKTKWQVGSIKTLENSDFVFKQDVRSQFSNDGRFIGITDYCMIDRSNITITYCGNFIQQSKWHQECDGILK